MILTSVTTSVEYKVFFGFCGLGGGAIGFQRGDPRVGHLQARFRTLGGFDVDPRCVRDFSRNVGVPATLLDLFDREQYRDFHGCEPPMHWREATVGDVRRAAGNENPNVIFLSPPCKGFSGLLSQKLSLTPKYQALNRLTLRGLWLMLEAFADDPPEFFLLENVPRIQSRGRDLLDRIIFLLNAYGYAVAETIHDCGEIGWLAQSRKRFLMVARHTAKVPPFLYEPPKRPLRAVGEILGRLPLPGYPIGGPMHAIPKLQWKTWVRLAFVEAGSDWRSLNRLQVVDGKLADYLLIPETRWEGSGRLGVLSWDEPAGTITADARPEKGAFSVADPRQEAYEHGYGVLDWKQAARTIQAKSLPSNGPFSVADPRFAGHEFGQYGVKKWDDSAGTVTSQRAPGQGPISVADPRMPEGPRGPHFNNVYRIVECGKPSSTVSSGHSPSVGGLGVVDPRPPDRDLFRKYFVTEWNNNTGTVIGGHSSEEGAYAVADPRPPWDRRSNNLSVEKWDEPSKTVIAGGKGVQGGWLSIADPRIAKSSERGANYLTAGHYGVVPWNQPSGAVPAAAGPDNGRWNVADPRLPHQDAKLVAIIRSLDDTWHRPFTTYELAALQNLFEPGESFELDGKSDSRWREAIGNCVPPASAKAIADVIGTTLLLSRMGQTFMLSAQPIWVKPLARAISVNVPLPPTESPSLKILND